MLVKRYHVKDMQQAMDTILKELGPDAVVLSSQKVKQKGLFNKPMLEVMVAYDPAKIPLAKKLNGSSGGNGYGKPAYEPPAYQPAVPAQPPAQAVRAYTGGAYAPSASGAGRPSRPAEDRYREDSFTPADFSRIAQAGQPAPLFEPVGDDEVVDVTDEEYAAPDLEELDSRISSLDHVLSDFISRFSYIKRDITYDYSEPVVKLLGKLVDNQVREELAHSLAREAEAILKRQPESDAYEIMEHLLLEELGAAQPIMPKKFKQKVVLLLGPTGVGKTTSLVKLAAKFSVGQKKKVGIINTDTYRIAAQEQLRTYTDILDVPLYVAYQPEELETALEEMSDLDLIFIDTAGKRPGDGQHREDVLKIMDLADPEDILLCVSASTGFASAKEIIDTYDFIDRFRLVVTKLDETRFRGMLLNLCWYAQKPLAYVTTGQNVPDDIENPEMEDIVKNLLK